METQTEIRSLWDSIMLWINEEAVGVIFTLVGILLILIVGKILISLLKKSLAKSLGKSKKINGLMQKLILRVVAAIAWIILLVIILGHAFQETLGNLLAGVMIAINSPFRIGDYVEIGSMSGSVKDMDMMSVTLATPDNKRVIMANKLIWGNAITNYSYTEKRRVELGASIAYGDDVSKAKEVLWGIINSYPEVLADPKPMIEVFKLNDSSVDLVVRPWTLPGDYWTVYYRFQQEVLEKFREAGLEIPFPQMDVHMPDAK
jgi:small conductance mechanosensitive channel